MAGTGGGPRPGPAAASAVGTAPGPAPGRAPNVVVVLLDDLGWAQLGCFGADHDTPAVDRLAAGGLRYSRFHVTALCSPTRACVLTGRNHHAVGMGFLADVPMTAPGYSARIPRSAAALPRVLRDAGYSTMAVGKWHLVPRWEVSASGPFDRWPLGLGFERYYGFLAGDTNQWAPNLVCDNHLVEAPRPPGPGYHLTEDLADTAIRMIRDQQHATPDKPFFLYLATGAVHAPHHVAPEWSDRYRGRFDGGWERWREAAFARQRALGVVPDGTTLTERPPWVQAWDDLPAEQRRLYARMQEVFAGFVSHTDHQIGRIVDFLAEIGQLDDTVVMVLSDNGASAEGGPIGSVNEHRFAFGFEEDLDDNLAHVDELGGPRAYNHYAWGWAWAGNTPFRLWKRYAWLGGTRTPLVVHWPRGIGAAGQVRTQACHAVDLMPTLLDLAGVPAPTSVDGVAQQPVDGASLRSTFDDPDAPAPRDTQYFEMLGSRALLHGRWKATTDHVSKGVAAEARVDGSRDFDTDRWALFDLGADFSEAHDVADGHPDVVRRLVELWWAEAGRNQVLPMDDTLVGRAALMEPSPHPPRHRSVYRPGGGPVADDVAPPLAGGFELTAHVEVGDGGVEGVLCAQGDRTNGWAVYVHDGRLVYALSAFGHLHRVAADSPVPPGATTLRVAYEREAGGGGTVVLAVDGVEVGRGRLPHDLPLRWQIGGAGMTVGRDRGLPVCDDYEPPFPWSGRLDRVEVVLAHLAPRDAVAEAELAVHAD